MRKNFSLSEQAMSAEAYVADAREWARRLEENEARGGTLEGARYRLEAKYGIATALFWTLRHRPPKRIAADIYHRLRLAYLSQCQRLVLSAQNDIEALKAKGHGDDDVTELDTQAKSLAQAIERARRRE